MIQRISKRFIALFLATVMVLGIMPATELPVHAATSGTLSGLANSDIGASWTGTDSGNNVSWSGDGRNIEGSVVGTKGTCNDTHYNTTLTITNNKKSAATLSFDYTIAQNSGTIQVDGTAVTADGTFSKELAAGESVKIYLKSGSTDNATSIAIMNLNLLMDVEATTTFISAEHGSYTVDGSAVSEETTKTQSSMTAYTFAATPDAGYKFMGWYSETEEKYLSAENPAAFNFDSDQTITAKFVAEDIPIFGVGVKRFTDLNEADAYANEQDTSKKITLVSDGKLPSGDYTISKGVTLLIPFDAAGTCYTTAPANTANVRTAPSVYRKLTMEAGASITVEGNLSVSAKHYAYGQNGAGAPDGKYGYIYMNEGSSITVNNGGGFYVYGFVSGNGTVTAKSGAAVYENMQICDFRGGSATSGMNNNAQKIFPLNQYFIQNIEAKLTLESGADEYIYTSLFAASTTTSTAVHFIGNSGAMFSVVESGSFTKQYLPDKDRVEIQVNGDAQINNLTLTVMGISISSASYVLPINNCMTLKVNSGTTKITQDIALLAGAEVDVAKDANLEITNGSSMYVYDSTEWTKANYASNAKFKTVLYSPTRTYTRKASDLIDARVDINGTVTANGYIYTTESGADIVSTEGTGKILFVNGAGTETATYMYKDYTTDFDTIPVTSAKLHNGATYGDTEEEYTLTEGASAGTVFAYQKEKDQWKADKEETYTVTWVDEDGTELEKDENVEAGTMPDYNGATPTKEGDAQYSYTFKGWTPKVSEVTADVTYKAVYEQTTNRYTVTWKNEDGTELVSEQVAYGEVPSYTGKTPTKEGNAEHSYTFSGWTPEITAVTKDAEYTAVYTEEAKTYTVTWKNEDGTVLETDENVAYGTTPEYNGETPSKEGDAQYSYTFKGWSPAVDTVTGDITYTAVYEQTVKQYTIIWKNEDGTELKSEQAAYGETPVYSGETPVKEGDEEYSYTFKGWTPEVTAVTGDATYTAAFDRTKNVYTVTWENADGTVLETDEEVPYGTKPDYNGTTPSKEDDADYRYTFKGWTPEITEETKVTGDVTYTAVYKKKELPKPKHQVTFNANGGEGTMEVQTVEEGKDATLAANAYTREGYTFAGWNTKADGTGATYADQAAIINLTEDLTLYAQWKHKDGWFTDSVGKTYYEDGQQIKAAWKTIDDAIYYFMDKGYVATGIFEVTPKEGTEPELCAFDGDGVFRKDKTGVFDAGSDTYWINAGIVEKYAGLKKVVDEKGHIHYYYFGEDNKAVKNGDYKVDKNNDLPLPAYRYQFDENGVIVHDEDTSKNGICEGDNSKFYYIDGVKVGEGLLSIDGTYYYARTSTGEIVQNRLYWITKTNNLPVEAGMYRFDQDGKMFLGGFAEENGSTYYYLQTGEIAKGFTKIGEDYYFFNAGSGKMYKDVTLWVGDNTYGITGGMYYFDEDGKMVVPDPENGEKRIVERNGKRYFTIDGAYMYDGLYELNGAYYYAKSNGELAANETIYISKTNGLIPKVGSGNWHAFDGSGKLIETGFVTAAGKDGNTYYYENNVLARGFTKIDGDYYFFNTGSGMMYKGKTLWVGNNTYGITGGMYDFDEDGKMILTEGGN